METFTRRLLAEVEDLSATERSRRVVGLARTLTGEQLDALVADLAEGDHYTRGLAVQMAVGARRAPALLRLAADTDAAWTGVILTALVRMGHGREVDPGAVLASSRVTRHELYREVRSVVDTELADRLIQPVRARFGDHEAAKIVVACSADTVARLLPELEHAITSFSGLTRRLPEVVLAHAEGHLASSRASARERGYTLVAQVLSVIALDEKERVLAWARTFVEAGRSVEFLGRTMGALTRHDPEAVAALITDSGWQSWSLRRRSVAEALADAAAGRADRVDFLAALLDTDDRSWTVRLLRAIPPRDRTAVVEAALITDSTTADSVDLTVLDLVPRADRERIASRLLSVPGAARRSSIDALIARLDWQSGSAHLIPLTRGPDADERAVAYRHLTECAVASRDPSIVAEFLIVLRRAHKEREPVRAAVLAALQAVPAHLLRPAGLGALGELIVAAMTARDRSTASVYASGSLLQRILIDAAIDDDRTAIGWVSDMYRQLGDAIALQYFGDLRGMPHGTERVVVEVLVPRLRADADVDHWNLLHSLADAVGNRLVNQPELVELLVRSCSAADDFTVSHAASLLVKWLPDRDGWVERLLTIDPSLITRWDLRYIVERRRTDLLGRFLNGTVSGRFLAPGIGHVIFFESTSAWTTTQRQAYRDQLLALAMPGNAPDWQHPDAIRGLSVIPGVADDLARAAAAPGPIAAAALTGLGSCDEPRRAIEVAAGFVDTDLSDVALTTIRDAALRMPSGESSGAIVALITARKVTSVKEGARLTAVLRPVDAAEVVSSLWRDATHRDIRIATMWAAMRLTDLADPVDRASMRRIVAEGSRSDAVLAQAATGPWQWAPEMRTSIGGWLVDGALRAIDAGSESGAEIVAARVLTALEDWAEWLAPEQVTLVSSWAADLNRTAFWRQATAIVVQAETGAGSTGEIIGLANALRRQSQVRIAHRDLPARQRLMQLIAEVAEQARVDRHAVTSALLLAELIADDADYLPALIELQVAAVHPEQGDIADGFVRLADTALPPGSGGWVRTAMSRWLMRHGPRPVDIEAAAVRLAQVSDGCAAYLLLEFVGYAGPRTYWAPPWSGLLDRLRSDQSTDVRAQALRMVRHVE